MVKEVTYNWGTCRSIRAKGKLKGKSAFTTTGQVLGMISFKPAFQKFQGGCHRESTVQVRAPYIDHH